MDTIIPQKQCLGPCGETYPATTDFFYKNVRGIFGVGPYCKKCHVQLNTERQRNLPPEKKERRRARGRRYYYAHQETMQGQHKQWYQDNREYALEKDRQFRIDHPEILAQRWQNWYQTENGKEHSRTRVRNRQARRKGASGNYTHADIQIKLEQQKHKCYYCGMKLDKYHVEHAIPIIRGGTNDISNIVLACPSCNLSKGVKFPHEWAQGGKLF